MNKNKALIPTSALVTLGVIVLSNVEKGEGVFSTREIVGYLVAFTMLSAMADMGLPIAGGFAVLIMVTIILMRGDKALRYITSQTEKPKKGTRKKKGGADFGGGEYELEAT
jgi:hypothetical protein